MSNSDYYERPMVLRLREIFGDPSKPERFCQKQFDGAQEDLIKTAAKDWHEINQSDYWHYLLDLCYVDLDQDLFNHLFPAFLIRWWEGQLNRMGGPESECDFYCAIDRGQILSKMMDESRRNQVMSWVVGAYIQGVDAWSGHLSDKYQSRGPDNLHSPLWSFHALGQSVPITASIWEQLADVSTEGRAQWWLVLASGLIWNENECPFVQTWTFLKGGGGIYVTGSEASIYRHGFLEANVSALKSLLTFESLKRNLVRSAELLSESTHAEWAEGALFEIRTNPERISSRIDRYKYLLTLPDLGGVRSRPLEC